MYKPCQFDRSEYLSHHKMFENAELNDVTMELCEFNEDIDDIAAELAYTRYQLAKVEKLLASNYTEGNNFENA